MKFRTLALATTSLVAFGLTVAPAGAAPAPMMGDISLGFGHTWENYDFGSEGSGGNVDHDYSAVIGQGRVNIPYSDEVNLQVDAIGRAALDDNIFGNKSSHFGIGGHVNYRDSQGLLGVFAGTGRVTDNFFSSAPVYMAGFEGQWYCGQWTFDGQLGYLDSGNTGSLLQNAGLVQVGGTYYASKTLKLTAGVGYIDGEVDGGEGDVKQWAWNVGIHRWFGVSIPVSGFIEYRGRSVDTTYSSSFGQLDEHTVNAGVTFHFGGDGFQDADRNGASENLPDYNLYRLFGSGPS